MEPRHLLRLEGLGGELVGVDAAGGHLGGAEALGAGRLQAPAVQPVRHRAQLPVRPIGPAALHASPGAAHHGAAPRPPCPPPRVPLLPRPPHPPPPPPPPPAPAR